MCDAFTRLDLEQVLRDVMPRADKSDAVKDLDKAGSEVAIAVREAFGDAIHNLYEARDVLDTDAPDGQTVLSAIDKVLAALSAVAELQTDLDSKLDALWEAEGKVTDEVEEDDGIDPEVLVEELAFRGYEIVRVPPRMRATVVPMPKKRGRPRKIPLSA